ncbi:glycosyltransferase [Pseudomonas sp. GW456-L14]|uniref:glycosyltransferase n=1 Tax=unclassified Pseudomonas TaxID=196821 RepID=UPI000C88B7FC|nr:MULTISPECIES: glycosyltransferase [unclassified Pseudomonas]PMY41997.1 glycosyltransferase [Pseudomonas sp. GW456-L14]PMY58729.1 glycosyltransferase [Pseudomonas sp. GW456-L12]
MNFILYSDVNDGSISQSLGRPEYSYYFVLKAYRPVLESLGRVHVVQTPAEVDRLYHELRLKGEDCLFLSFTPPQKTPVDLDCPTLCVVAWEFDSIPHEYWDNDPHQDWSRTLGRHGRVITLSSHTARAVRRVLGEHFPVLVLPTPLWERFDGVRGQYPNVPVNAGTTLQIKGCIIDSRALGLSADGLVAPVLDEAPPPPAPVEAEIVEAPPLTVRRRLFIAKHYLREWYRALAGGEWRRPLFISKHYVRECYREGLRDRVPERLRALMAKSRPEHAAALPVVLPVPAPEPEHPQAVLPATDRQVEFQVDGVVYVSVFNPDDGRKNWHQLITAFCWAMRDTEDATLVLKMTQNDLSTYYVEMLTLLSQLSPFSCRVVAMHGYLDDEQFARLYGAASFYVNASRCEGLCLPLMEFMACGKPVIAPLHTAMLDYIDEDVAFVVKSSQEPAIWPQDSRILFRTLRHRPDWGSLKTAYQDSYRMAKENPAGYQSMSLAAARRMQEYSSFASVQGRLREFFALTPLTEADGASSLAVAGNA